MIPILRAFALLRWRLFVNGLRGRRRDSLEQVSRISRVFVFAVVALSVVPASVALAGLAGIGAWGLARGSAQAPALFVVAGAVLGVVTLVVVVLPLLRFGGGSTSTTRLALLPIPRRLLFAAQVAAQAADPWILAVVPGLLAVPAGFVAGGAPRAAAWSFVAGALMVGVLAALGSAVSLFGALLFRNRRAGEIVTIAVFVAITCVAYAPAMLQRAFLTRRTVSYEGTGRKPVVVEDTPRPSPERAFRFLPSALYVSALRRAASGTPPSPALPVAGLLAACALLGGAAHVAFSRLMDGPGDRRARSARSRARLARLPGLTPAASAVAVATFRLLLRSVRGRLILFTSPLPILMLAFLSREDELAASLPAHFVPGPALLALGGFLALLSIGQILADQFAVDRAGLTLAFLSPAGERDLIVGKAAGAALAASIPTAAALVVAIVLRPGGSPLLWLAALEVVGAVFGVQAAAAAILAAAFPAPYDLMKLRAGNPHALASAVTMAVTMIGFGIAGGSVALAYALSRSGLLASGVATAVLALACGAAALGLPLAARTLHARRENLAMVAQGR